jgi:hypothetical protein
MAKRRKRDEPPVPRFPRQTWKPGQAPRAEKPKKGRGSYERSRQEREIRKDVQQDLE